MHRRSIELRNHRLGVPTLLAKGAVVNAKTNDGITALILAAKYGVSDNMRTLIEKDADVNAKDNEGCTALMGAKNMNHRDR